MDTATAQPEVVTPPVVDTPASDESNSSEAVAEPSSIAELSEATFGKPSSDDESADATPGQPRTWGGKFTKQQGHRSASHQAKAGDVDEIQAQTARLRQAEKDAGITAPEKKPGESDRAYALRRQADIAEALRDARKAGTAAAQNGSGTRHDAPGATNAPPAARKAVEFDKPRPKADQFAQADDPAEAYIEALADWRFDKRIHDAQQIAIGQHERQSHAAAIAQGQKHEAAINAKITEYLKEKPDYWQVLDQVENIRLPDVALHAIAVDVDNVPKLNYYLATHRRELLNLVAFARNLDLSQDSVDLVREYLADVHAQIQGAGETPTGPPASATPVIVAPRPPRSVGTGSLKTGEDPPAEPASIAEFARFYGPKARR